MMHFISSGDAEGSLSTLTIITASLPNATVGAAYSASLAATGGTAPYTWSLVSATPDTGTWISVAASGVVSGTPGTAETESVTVKVSDAQGASAQATIPLIVNAAGQTFNYYIATTGSDANPGTLASPWAITAINTKQATYGGLGKRIGLLPGTYSLQSLAASRGSGNNGYLNWVLDIDGGTSGNPTYVGSSDASGNYLRGTAILDQSSTATFTAVIGSGSTSMSISGVTGTVLIGMVVTGTGIPVDTYITAGSGTSWTLNQAPSGAVNTAATGVCYGNPNNNNTGPNARAGNPTIGHSGKTAHVGYVTIDGVAIIGNISAGVEISNVALGGTIPGITIQNCEFYGNNGVGSESGDNLCSVSIANCSGCLISNNYFHDNTGYNTNSSQHRSATLQWASSGTVVEYNTCLRSGGLYGKEAQTGGSTLRFNYVDDSNDTNGDTSWAAISDYVESSATNSFYGNIVIGQHPLSAIKNLGGASTGPVEVYNNTVVIKTPGGDYYGIATSINSPGTLKLYNNIVYNATGGNMTEGFGLHTLATISLMDYNGYFKGSGSDHWTSWTNQGSGTAYTSLASWQSATVAEAHSLANTASPLFVGTGAQLSDQYQLQSGSTAKGLGRVGGTSGGAAIDAGAWGCINPATGLTTTQVGCSFGA